MKRHVLEQNFQKHRGQQYSKGFGKAFESERDTRSTIDRDQNGEFSGKADWNNDTNQNMSSPEVRNGNYGKGPRNYRRSDERIYESVCQALSDDPEVDASDIEVQVNDGEVTLEGTVSSRGMKKAAEFIAEDQSWVIDVQNRLKVQ